MRYKLMMAPKDLAFVEIDWSDDVDSLIKKSQDFINHPKKYIHGVIIDYENCVTTYTGYHCDLILREPDTQKAKFYHWYETLESARFRFGGSGEKRSDFIKKEVDSNPIEDS